MKTPIRQLAAGLFVSILILWTVIFPRWPVATGEVVAHHATPPAERHEVGVDTGSVHVIAYSSDSGDAYVRIDGDKIYAEASLRGVIVTPLATPTTQPTPTQAVVDPTPTPTPEVVSLILSAIANVRSAPWGAVLGTAQPGETYRATGVANPWYRFDWNGREAWVRGDLVMVNGATSTLPVVSISVVEPVAAVPTATPAPVVAPVVEVVAQDFIASYPNFLPEANHPAFYAQVMQNGNAAPGRWCVVFHDQIEVGRAETANVLDETNKGTPWEDDNYAFNCEVKFYQHNDQSEVGTWHVELRDGAGSVIGRSVDFTIPSDRQQVWLSFLKFD